MSEDKATVPTISHKTSSSNTVPSITRDAGEYPLSAIEEAVRSIQFGTVQIVIQDGRIVQIEKTEKIRLR